MKKILISFILASSLLAFAACSQADSEEYAEYRKETTYLTENDEELQSKCEDEEQIKIAKQVISDAEAAFKTVDTEASKYDFGACSYYCPNKEKLKYGLKDLSIEYLNTKQDGDSGYIWVEYTVEYGGNQASHALSKWDIKKIDGKWKVVKIYEGF